MPSFSDALTLTADGDSFVGTFTADRAQARAAFGGVIAGLAIRASGARVVAEYSR